MAVLCGFMIGDMSPEAEEFKHETFMYLAPADIPVDARLWVTLGIGICAALLVLVLD